ncbi:MAG: hypothetical protein J6B41_01600 [Alistipes sp.]|nr:hypothetical protein [Alistipes sp.]
MKKFLFVLAALICFALPKAEAQNGFIDSSMTKVEVIEPEPEAPPVKIVEIDKGVKHFAELEFGLPLIETTEGEDGDGDTCTFGIGANYVVGYKFNNHVFLGGGFGIGFLNMRQNYYYIWSDNFKDDGLYAKLFINSKIYITKTKVQPFVDLNIGGILFKQADDWESKKVGVILSPQVGVNFKLKNKGAIFATIGGNIMPKYYPEGYFTLKIGYAF